MRSAIFKRQSENHTAGPNCARGKGHLKPHRNWTNGMNRQRLPITSCIR